MASTLKKIQLIPLILNFGDDNFYGPWDKKFFDPGYGIGTHPQDFHKALPRYHHSSDRHEYYNHRKNWRGIEMRDTTPKRRENIGKEGFQVCVDVHQFAPNEITVKTVDHALVIEAEHEERQDQIGYISRHFRRRYILPREYDVQDVKALLSSDGVLTVKAPPILTTMQGCEREVQIHHTGPAYLNVRSIGEPVDVEVTAAAAAAAEEENDEDFELLEEDATGSSSKSGK